MEPYISQSAEDVKYTDFFSAEGSHPHINECPVDDTEQSDVEVLVILELWGKRSIPLLLSLSCHTGPEL